MGEEQQFIVAEVSQNWERGGPHDDLLSRRFELVIEVNRARGYGLHSFQFHQVMVSPDLLTETIIAVFERQRVSVEGEDFAEDEEEGTRMPTCPDCGTCAPYADEAGEECGQPKPGGGRCRGVMR